MKKVGILKLFGIVAAGSICFSLAGCGAGDGNSSRDASRTQSVASGTAVQTKADEQSEGMRTVTKEETGKSDTEQIPEDGEEWNEAMLQDVSYSNEKGSIFFTLRPGWNYKIHKNEKKKDNSFYIELWKGEHEKNGRNTLEISYNMFQGYCGTGLECEDVTIHGMQAEKGMYDGRKIGFDFINFQGDYEKYSIMSFCTDKWWKKNEEEVMNILETVVFS